MTSKTAEAAAYIEEAPANRRTATEQLRSLCRQNLTGYQECMEYGMPGYKRNALYAKRVLVNEFPKAWGPAKIAKSCVRFHQPGDIDFAIIAKLLRRKKATPGCLC